MVYIVPKQINIQQNLPKEYSILQYKMPDENPAGIHNYYLSSLFLACKWCNKEDCSIFGFPIVATLCLIKLPYTKEKVNHHMSLNHVSLIKTDQ